MPEKFESAVEITKQLIRFPTVSRDSNLDLIDFIAGYLKGFGIESVLVRDPVEKKANLFATIGPVEVPGLILSGHTDVVPVDGQNWSQDPFSPWIDGDNLFGRGSADMKAFIGIVLSMVPEFAAGDLKMPVHFAFSYDEEVGCTGVLSLIEYVNAMEVKPRLCIVGEPTMMAVINSHKGIRSFRTRIRGQAAHSSAPHLGANAIAAAADLIGHIGEISREIMERPGADNRFYTPFTTTNIGTIEGGAAINIIAEHAVFEWEYRPIPGADADEIRDRFFTYAEKTVLPKLQKTAKDATIKTEELSFAPPLIADPNSSAEAFVMGLLGTNETGAVSYATEAGLFQGKGNIPTVVCGPGSIDQAHRPDEFIAFSQIEAGLAFMDRLLRRISS